jgi:anti-sigma regulatory factor (Ser/Thr protein kinase)
MKHKLVINSNLKALKDLYQWMKILLTNHDVKGKTLRNILLITQEMTTNSILHGNKSQIDKIVTIEVTIDEKISVEIEDEGEGIKQFPSHEEAIELDYIAENGRGLKLAVLMTDSIELCGNRVKYIFNR